MATAELTTTCTSATIEAKEAAEEGTQNGCPVVSNRRAMAIYSSMLLMHLVLAVDTTSIVLALPTIAREMQADERTVYSIGSIFALAATVFQQPVAEVSHILGRKPAILFTLLALFLGSLLCALSNNMSALLVGRVLQGVGSAGAQLSNLVLTDVLSIRDRAIWLPAQNVVWCVGLISGPLLGATLMKLSWRWLFWINLAPLAVSFCALTLLLGFDRPMGEIRKNVKQIDWLGLGIFMPSTVSLLLPMSIGGSAVPWASWQTLLPLSIGVCGLLVLVYQQRFLAAQPMFRKELFHRWAGVSCFLNQIIFGFCLNMLFYYLVIFWVGVRHMSDLQAGLALLPQLIAIPLAAILTGYGIRSTGYVFPPLVAGWFLSMAGVLMLWYMDGSTSLSALLVINGFVGFACGMVVSSINCAISSVMTKQDQGHAMAMGGLFRSAGSTLGISGGAALFSTTVASKLEAHGVDLTPDTLIRTLRQAGQDPVVASIVEQSLDHLWLLGAGLGLGAWLMVMSCARAYPNLITKEREEKEAEASRRSSVAWANQAHAEMVTVSQGASPPTRSPLWEGFKPSR